MDTARPPEVVREKISHVGGGRVSCALIFGREFSSEEVSGFYAVRAEEPPAAADFEVAGRVIRYDCAETDEPKWRLAAEIFLVKSFRAAPRRRSPDSDARARLGLRPLQR
jgi:hypothetical protein